MTNTAPRGAQGANAAEETVRRVGPQLRLQYSRVLQHLDRQLQYVQPELALALGSGH